MLLRLSAMPWKPTVGDYEPMNAVYASNFPAGERPARTCVGVTALARGARIEIDFVAKR